MINTNIAKSYCREDLSLIENYNEAANDLTQVWDCHHRLEIQNEKVVLRSDLIKQGLYYHRPAEELIFLMHSEHTKLHNTGKYNHNYGKPAWNKGIKTGPHSEETLKKISESNKGKPAWNKGKTGIYSEETKQKISNTLKGNIPWNKGKKMSEAYKESCKKGWITRKRKSQK